MANLAVWSRALTPEEIQSIMNKSYSQLKGVEKTSLVSWWALDSQSDGLVQPTTGEELSAELALDGGFDTDVSAGSSSDDWALSSVTHEISNGRYRYTDSGTGILRLKRGGSNIVLTLNKLHKLTFEIFDNNAYIAFATDSEILIANATYPVGTNTVYFIPTASHSDFDIKPHSSSSSFSMDNFSLKEVLQSEVSDTYPAIIDVNEPVLGVDQVTNGTFDADSNWTKGTGWSIGSGVASCDGTQTGNTNLQQNDVFTVGNLYKITFDLTRTAGNFRLLVGSSGSSSYYTTDGSFTLYATAVGNANLYIQGDSNFIGTVDNVTVKEIQGNVGTMTNQDSADLVYSSVLPDQSFLTGVNSAYNFIDFDTTDEYIDTGDSIGDSLGNDYTGTLTVAMWIKYDPSVITGSGNGGMFYMGYFNGTYGEVNIYAISSNRIQFHINEVSSKYRFRLTDTSTDWKHIAFVIDPNVEGNNKVYLNGVDQELTAIDSPTFPLDLDFTSKNTIIGAYYNTSYTFGGSIGQTALWTKSLTDAEILAIYNLGRHGNLLDSYSDNLKGYWAMGALDAKTGLSDVGDGTIYDRSGR
jgi:hypothetical protein